MLYTIKTQALLKPGLKGSVIQNLIYKLIIIKFDTAKSIDTFLKATKVYNAQQKFLMKNMYSLTLPHKIRC